MDQILSAKRQAEPQKAHALAFEDCPAPQNIGEAPFPRSVLPMKTTQQRHTPQPSEPRALRIALIPAGAEPLSREFAAQFVRVLRSHTKTKVLRSQNAARSCADGNTSIDASVVTQTRNELKSQFGCIVFVADRDERAWADKAIRHADLVIAAGRHGANPQPNALETLAARYLPPEACRIVLLHTKRGRVSGTRAWLASRPAVMHHHVALDRDEDVHRLVRFVRGTARGLVACGGGAVCAAHVGVYKALVESGFEFDMMGGASAGSAVVAGFILGTSPEDMDRAIHDMFVERKAMRRFTLSRYSLLDHANFDRELAALFGGIDIEDLWLPFFAVSTNLSSYTLHRHQHGDLWTAIRASVSVPVLLPPIYTSNGEMLVDGSLLDNVPVQTMRDLKSGPNIVIDFSIPQRSRYDVDYPSLPTGGALIKRALNPIRRKCLPAAPGPITVLMRSLMAGRQNFKRYMREEDLLLVPPIPADIGFLDWHRHRELFASSYGWARNELARLEGHPPSACAVPARSP